MDHFDSIAITLRKIAYTLRSCPLTDAETADSEHVVEIGPDGRVKVTERLRSRRTGREVKGFNATRGLDCDRALAARLLGLALSKGVLGRRKTSMTDYRLERAAGCPCATELRSRSRPKSRSVATCGRRRALFPNR